MSTTLRGRIDEINVDIPSCDSACGVAKLRVNTRSVEVKKRKRRVASFDVVPGKATENPGIRCFDVVDESQAHDVVVNNIHCKRQCIHAKDN